MLMKHSQVSRQGEVSEPVRPIQGIFSDIRGAMTADWQPLAQLTYGALLSGRTSMVTDSSNSAKKVSLEAVGLLMLEAWLTEKALTIAVRYAAVRRQFSSGKNQVCLLHVTPKQHRQRGLTCSSRRRSSTTRFTNVD